MSSTQELADTIKALWVLGHTEWMSLASLRTELAGLEDAPTRTEVDAALTHLVATHTARVIPESNQKTLTDEDREAALWLGGEWRHLISFK